MQKIYSFNGKKELAILNKEDYARVEDGLFDNDYKEIAILTKSDFRTAVKNNCKIYYKMFHYDGYSVERCFIRINRDKLFSNAEKNETEN